MNELDCWYRSNPVVFDIPATEFESRLGFVFVSEEQLRITIVDYDAQWPVLFSREESRVRDVLGDRVLAIEHVGSTAVPGLAAKPRIDILLVINNSADE